MYASKPIERTSLPDELNLILAIWAVAFRFAHDSLDISVCHRQAQAKVSAAEVLIDKKGRIIDLLNEERSFPEFLFSSYLTDPTDWTDRLIDLRKAEFTVMLRAPVMETMGKMLDSRTKRNKRRIARAVF